MLILALDTTTRLGGVAVMRESRLLEARVGDPTRTHGERLPADVLDLLGEHGLTPRDVDLFAVCAGPGSFTGLRVGLATIQGLAMAGHRRVVPVPTLEALAYAGWWARPSGRPGPTLVVPFMNAQRSEVFSAVYAVEGDRLDEIQPPTVGAAEAILDRWRETLAGRRSLVVGDGLTTNAPRVTERLGARAIYDPTLPPLAPAVARRAAARSPADWLGPGQLHPVYVRRPDAELARDRRRTTHRGTHVTS